MKKTLSFLLIVILILNITSIVFAVPEDEQGFIDPLQTVTGILYEEEFLEIFSEEIPGAAPNDFDLLGDVEGVLPKTGGIPAEAFYSVGLLIMITGIILLVKKQK